MKYSHWNIVTYATKYSQVLTLKSGLLTIKSQSNAYWAVFTITFMWINMMKEMTKCHKNLMGVKWTCVKSLKAKLTTVSPCCVFVCVFCWDITTGQSHILNILHSWLALSICCTNTVKPFEQISRWFLANRQDCVFCTLIHRPLIVQIQADCLEVGHQNAAGIISGRQAYFLPVDMIINIKIFKDWWVYHLMPLEGDKGS